MGFWDTHPELGLFTDVHASKVYAGGVLLTAGSGGASDAWPVGAVFLSVVSTNPATLLGFGTWASIGAGRVLVGLDTADADFNTVEGTGGAKTVTPSAHAGVTVGASGAGSSHTHGGPPTHTFTQPTISWPAGVPTNAGGAVNAHSVTQPSDHTFTQPTVAWPAGVPTNSGGAVDAHAVTQPANHTFTQPTIAWPVGVPTNSGGAVDAHGGTAVADHASHTHTYTDVVNHVHVENVNSATTGPLSGWTPDTSTNTSTASGYSTANPTGGVATGTTAGPSATLTHSVTQPANHVFTQPTVAWPAGVPTNSGGAVNAHSGTAVAAHSFTQPTVAWPAGVPTNSGGAVTAHAGTAVADHTFTQPTISWPAGVPTNASGAVDAHGSTGAEATHTHPTGAVTQPNDHSAMSVVQPYLVVYMWKRTL